MEESIIVLEMTFGPVQRWGRAIQSASQSTDNYRMAKASIAACYSGLYEGDEGRSTCPLYA